MAEQQVQVGSLALIILNKAAATGAGSAVDLGFARGTFTTQTVVTGAPASVSCKLQGSLDGTNWSDLTTSTSTTGDQQYAVDKPQKYVRANLGTLTGGTAPTVTVYVAAI